MAGSVPYIGSRMSLISKAEIRYEGFLHEIDTNNTTVTLKNVRSFGTENRRTDKVIPPKDDVFQYIIFRGSDIKDISVCESAAFTDPAIVQSGPPAAANARAQGQSGSQTAVGASITPDPVSPTPATFPPFGMPAPTQAKPHPPTVPSPQLFREVNTVNESQISPEPLVDQSRQLNSVTDQSSNRANTQVRQPPRQNSGFRNDNNGGNFRRNENNRSENRSYSATARQGQGQFSRNYQEYQRSYAYNPSNNPYNNYNGNQNSNYRNQNMSTTPLLSGVPGTNGNNGNRGPPMGNRGFNNYQNNYRWNQNGPNGRRVGQRNSNRQSDNPTATGDFKIDEDFDIDDANRKFDKSQLVKEFANLSMHEVEASQITNLSELEEGELADDMRNSEASKFYDKSKSFFDSISCDALEKKTSRLTTAEEKRLNVQTFGSPSVLRNRPSGPSNYSNNSFRPRSAGNFGSDNYYRRNGNYYGGFNNAAASNYRRGPGSNSYYTSNYSSSHGSGQNGPRQQNYYHRQNAPQTGASNSARITQPTQA